MVATVTPSLNLTLFPCTQQSIQKHVLKIPGRKLVYIFIFKTPPYLNLSVALTQLKLAIKITVMGVVNRNEIIS